VVALSILARTTNPVVPLDRHTNRRTVARALDQIALPVTRNEAILDLRRPGVDALHVGDLALAIGASLARFAYLIMVPQAGYQLALKLSAEGK
jgi:hypothetical protein